MPLIKIETNQALSANESQKLCENLSRLAAEVLGKPEQYVQVVLHQNPDQHLFIMHGGLPGGAGHAAFVDVRSIGGLSPQVNRVLAKRICALLAEVDVPGERVYLNFTDVSASNWGHNGAIFG